LIDFLGSNVVVGHSKILRQETLLDSKVQILRQNTILDDVSTQLNENFEQNEEKVKEKTVIGILFSRNSKFENLTIEVNKELLFGRSRKCNVR